MKQLIIVVAKATEPLIVSIAPVATTEQLVACTRANHGICASLYAMQPQTVKCTAVMWRRN